jgi:acyl-coenzyme A synthetase/AMP-(fatty) acid ligase
LAAPDPALSEWCAGAPPALPASFNLAAHVLAAADRAPDRVALVLAGLSGAERWSWGRLAAAVRGVGTGLQRAGLRPGDRVLMRLGNSVAFPLLFLGAAAAGIVPVASAAGLTGDEIGAAAATVAPAMIVADAGIALPDPLPCPVLAAAEVLGWERLPPCAWDMGDPHRAGYVVFTSGTSGRPMPVLHAHRAVLARVMMRDGWQGLGAGDRVLHAGAMNWTYTLGAGLLDPWAAGAVAVVPQAGVTAAQLALLARRHDATILAAAPGLFRQMLAAGVPALPRLRHGLSAGEALLPALRDRWRAETGTDLHEALGMSEVSTFVSGSPARPAPPGTAGWAQDGRRVAVLGEDGRAVPRGSSGMLAVHRSDPGLFLGYPGDAAATAARYRGDWFLTGDLVTMRADGAIRYDGRADDQINAGGFRVSPVEIETVVTACPGVTAAAAVEHAVRPGVTVVACCYVGEADAAALAAHTAGHLARWKQPRLWHRMDSLPAGRTGKTDRRAVRAALALAFPAAEA